MQVLTCQVDFPAHWWAVLCILTTLTHGLTDLVQREFCFASYMQWQTAREALKLRRDKMGLGSKAQS